MINHRFSAFEMRTGPLNTVRNKDKHAANQAFSDKKTWDPLSTWMTWAKGCSLASGGKCNDCLHASSELHLLQDWVRSCLQSVRQVDTIPPDCKQFGSIWKLFKPVMGT